MKKLNLDPTSVSHRKEWSWTPRNNARRDDIKTVLDEMRQYWPLTLRQLYYRLISSDLVQAPHWKWKGKPVDMYPALMRTMKWMRIHNIVPMSCIKDTHRILTVKRGYDDMNDFIENRLDFTFSSYSRCLAQDQPRHLEVWLEKQALLGLVEPVADEFCRRVMVARGYNSITFQAGFYQRASYALEAGLIPTVLYFGDFDPSGVNMIYAAMQTIEEELGLDDVEYYRCGINPSHFDNIHGSPVPIKPTDSRSRKFIEQYGATAYELDAFHPAELKHLVRESIKKMTDMEILEQNVNIESNELAAVDKMDEYLDGAREIIKQLA